MLAYDDSDDDDNEVVAREHDAVWVNLPNGERRRAEVVHTGYYANDTWTLDVTMHDHLIADHMDGCVVPVSADAVLPFTPAAQRRVHDGQTPTSSPRKTHMGALRDPTDETLK